MTSQNGEDSGTRDRGGYRLTEEASPIATIISRLEGGPYYLISEVSKITGIPISTLRRWYKRGVDQGGTKAPSKVHQHLGIKIYLYTDEDLAEIQSRRQRTTTIKDRMET